MGRIYSNADTVLAWVGESDGDSDAVFDLVADVNVLMDEMSKTRKDREDEEAKVVASSVSLGRGLAIWNSGCFHDSGPRQDSPGPWLGSSGKVWYIDIRVHPSCRSFSNVTEGSSGLGSSGFGSGFSMKTIYTTTLPEFQEDNYILTYCTNLGS